MTFKPNLSRLARLEAGSRLSLPGQDPLREEELRIELTEELQPKGRFELIWVEDIAYRIAAIEVIRAQIAGYKMRLIEAVLADIARRGYRSHPQGNWFRDDDDPIGPIVSEAERAVFEEWRGRGTVPVPLTSWLSDPGFAWLLGKLGEKELAALRQLQIHEQEEVRERDRIIKQFERRRQQAVRDAVELVAARRRACLPVDGVAPALEGPRGVEDDIGGDVDHGSDSDDADVPAPKAEVT